jgi:hypothetical protein
MKSEINENNIKNHFLPSALTRVYNCTNLRENDNTDLQSWRHTAVTNFIQYFIRHPSPIVKSARKQNYLDHQRELRRNRSTTVQICCIHQILAGGEA